VAIDTKKLKQVIKVIQGDIFAADYDAIINPANVSLLAGSGLCGQIHKRSGPNLELSCKNLGSQNEGNAVVTPAFGLTNCDWVIHACGPRWFDGKRGEAEKLALVHEAIIDLALAHKFESIAIPAISTGVYRFPVKQAAQIAVNTCQPLLSEFGAEKLQLTFVLPQSEKYSIYTQTLLDLSNNETH